ncbi:PcfJ-like protein [uncultured Caudovirales phage]|uniref:PcfJ-like protein n=1 Tax=uncultured Caudovirales phage TaxID=2100421 RepID=A0A6J5L605_9CAUD|nr:PcfJ-like protein [uncultured Caudovirales phage]
MSGPGFDVEAARAEGYSDSEIAQHLLDINNADRESASDTEVINTLAPISAAPVQEVKPLENNEEGVSDPLGTGVTAATLPAILQGSAFLKHKIFDGKESAVPAPVETPKADVKGIDVGVVSPHGYDPDIAGVAEYNKEQSAAHDLKMGRPSPKSIVAPPAGFEIKGNSRILSPIGSYQTPAEAAKMQIDMENSTLGNRIKTGAAKTAKGIPGAIANTPAFGKIGMAGYNAQDAWNNNQQGNTGRAAIATAGTLGSLASLLNKYPKTRAIGAGVSLAAPAINRAIDYFYPPEAEHKAGGGKVGALTELAKPALKKLSEVLGPHEDSYLGLTQSDNFGIHGNRMGGNRFPEFQNTSPKHAEDRVVWMNDTENHANSMAKNSTINGKPVVWSTYIGAPDQLKSNKSVFQDILDNHYARDLSPDQVDLINARIKALSKGNAKKPVFQEPFDIRDRFATQELGGDTFGGRATLADMLGLGEGVGKTKSGIILPNYEDILASHRDPLTVGQPTSSVGSQLFTVDPTLSKFSTEYHPDYNWTVHGENLNTPFEFTPHEAAAKDWYQRQFAKTGKAPHGNSWFNYMKDPQHITEDYLTSLQKAGYAEGGEVEHYAPGGLVELAQHLPQMLDTVAHYGALGLGTIKGVGGNWFPPVQEHIENTLNRISQNPDVNKWLSTTGRKYILNRLGSSEDEVKKLYDQGISHLTPAQLAERTADHFQPGDSLDVEQLGRKRKLQGFPETGNAYENAIDASIQPRDASHWQQGNTSVPMPEWVSKLDPKSKMYGESNYAQIPRVAGMDTLARTIEKDIAAGKLRPEQLNKVSIEDAVRRAHQQRIEAQAASDKASKSIPKVREYPSGYAWHDLTHEDPATLDTILKQEGDTMQNCIGGYCSDVLEDGTKLYSLRDPAGNPHVNVEVKQSPKGPVVRQVRGKQNELPTEDYIPYARDFAINPVGDVPYSDIWGAGDLGLHDVNKIKQHGLVEGSMGPYYGALDRLFPTEIDPTGGRVLGGQYGTKIPTTEMLRMSTEDLPGRYVTQDQLLEHLNAQEPRPIEQGYSKYYKGTENFAGGGRVGAIETLMEEAPKIYQGAKDLISPLASEVNSRINMNYKDVTKRVPELGEAFKKLMSGDIGHDEYDAVVNQFKPVTPFSTVPTPATREEAVNALQGDRKNLYGVPSQTLKQGHPVGLRLDIPAYRDHGVWVPTIHEQKAGFGAGKAIGHESVASILNPSFGMSEEAAASIASGKPKGTIATIKGDWNQIDPDHAVKNAEYYLDHPDWIQVGMDPERHSFFYDRATMQPVTHADEALQIGPLVFAKKPKYGNRADYKYAEGGEVVKSAQELIAQMNPSIMRDILQRTRLVGGGGSGDSGFGGQVSYVQPLDKNNALQFALSGHVAPEDSAVDEIRANFIHNF